MAKSKIYTLERVMRMPLIEAFKILSIGLSLHPAEIEIDDSEGTGRLLVKSPSGVISEMISPISFALHEDPRLPVFDESLGSFLIQGGS